MTEQTSWVCLSMWVYVYETSLVFRDITHIYTRPCPLQPLTPLGVFRGAVGLFLFRLEAKNLILMSTLRNFSRFCYYLFSSCVIQLSVLYSTCEWKWFSASSAKQMKILLFLDISTRPKNFFLSQFFLFDMAEKLKLCKNGKCFCVLFERGSQHIYLFDLRAKINGKQDAFPSQQKSTHREVSSGRHFHITWSSEGKQKAQLAKNIGRRSVGVKRGCWRCLGKFPFFFW